MKPTQSAEHERALEAALAVPSISDMLLYGGILTEDDVSQVVEAVLRAVHSDEEVTP